MVKGCHLIDEFLKGRERPIMNLGIARQSYPKIARDVPLLANPSRRDVEILIYSADKKWWRQAPIKAGEITTTIQLGNDSTKSGAEYNVIALTTEQPLNQQTYPNIPDHRTRSDEITLRRH